MYKVYKRLYIQGLEAIEERIKYYIPILNNRFFTAHNECNIINKK